MESYQQADFSFFKMLIWFGAFVLAEEYCYQCKKLFVPQLATHHYRMREIQTITFDTQPEAGPDLRLMLAMNYVGTNLGLECWYYSCIIDTTLHYIRDGKSLQNNTGKTASLKISTQNICKIWSKQSKNEQICKKKNENL